MAKKQYDHCINPPCLPHSVPKSPHHSELKSLSVSRRSSVLQSWNFLFSKNHLHPFPMFISSSTKTSLYSNKMFLIQWQSIQLVVTNTLTKSLVSLCKSQSHPHSVQVSPTGSPKGFLHQIQLVHTQPIFYWSKVSDSYLPRTICFISVAKVFKTQFQSITQSVWRFPSCRS